MSATSAPDPEPVEVGSVEELEGYLRQAVTAGNMPDVLCLLEVAREMGPDIADRVYGDIVRPGLVARWQAGIQGEPGAPELTEDELAMLMQLASDWIGASRADSR
jgi:hypothetical protein